MTFFPILRESKFETIFPRPKMNSFDNTHAFPAYRKTGRIDFLFITIFLDKFSCLWYSWEGLFIFTQNEQNVVFRTRNIKGKGNNDRRAQYLVSFFPFENIEKIHVHRRLRKKKKQSILFKYIRIMIVTVPFDAADV